MTETINGIEILVGEDEILKAVEFYLNERIFKEPLRVCSVRRGSFYDTNNTFKEGFKVVVETTLQRLAGEGGTKE